MVDGRRRDAIRAMGVTPIRYYQLLNRLLATERSMAYAAVTVHRLRRIVGAPIW
ncbi:DUF3263 domain-containing protein [Mycolicibacterium sp. BiH015]|uniref:DUF3263 domain-containing protein n=1 Tax=Mycolicibacterium sp. BiH015 TaxID=3018808 RepID=UPI0022E25838|nr:DUF3263 domain-containing protein [Mycolicibacterium sp. BiH015]MDA2893428.1 DUF3263 domain-containing protein [Mycolicibacterium sp. BiH015]